MENVKENALKVCLNDEISPEMQYEMLLDLGLDLEDMFEIAMIAAEKQR